MSLFTGYQETSSVCDYDYFQWGINTIEVPYIKVRRMRREATIAKQQNLTTDSNTRCTRVSIIPSTDDGVNLLRDTGLDACVFIQFHFPMKQVHQCLRVVSSASVSFFLDFKQHEIIIK